MGQEFSLPAGDKDEGGRCPECGHDPHLPSWCGVSMYDEEGVECGCQPTCSRCGSDEHLEPKDCECGHPCHKRWDCGSTESHYTTYGHKIWSRCACMNGPP
jgi:hypothetical protein